MERVICIRSKDGQIEETVAVSFSDHEVSLLQQYLGHVRRLRETRLVRSVGFGTWSFSWKRLSDDEDNGCDVQHSTTLPDDESYDQFFLRFRMLYLKEEDASFEKTQNLVKKLVQSDLLRAGVKALWAQFSGGPGYTPPLQVAVESEAGKRLLVSNDMLNIYLNAKVYHSDHAKQQALRDLTVVLPMEVINFHVLQRVEGMLAAIFALDTIVRGILGDEQDV